MPPPPDRRDARTLPGELPGTDEVPVVHWPRIWRDRVRRRVAAPERRRWVVLATVLLGLFATGFTITVLAVSVGTIAADLGTSETTLSWIVTGPLLTLAICMPVFGKLGDLHGHRRLYLGGYAGFTAVTAITAFAWDGSSLIALRMLGALFGAATGPASMALIMHEFPVRDRVQAMGWWSLVGAGAPVFGLVVGGPVVETIGWRAIFLIQAPVSALAVALAVVVLHETPRRPREPVDVAGAGLLALGMVALLLALSEGDRWGWTSPGVLGLLGLSPLALGGFVAVERRAASPLLPLEFFRRANFAPSLVAQFASNFAYMGGFFITPLFMQHQLGWGVSATGYAMLCRPLTFSLSSPFAGYLATRVGERAAAVFGTALVVASMGGFALAAAHDTVAAVFVALVLSGLGLGASSPSLVSSVANAVEPEDLGVANAAQVMVAQLGVSVGIQLMIAVQAGATFTAAYAVGGAVALLGVGAAARLRSLDRGPVPAVAA
jgi:EmrB/QacA subfamily drug resistance transporter